MRVLHLIDAASPQACATTFALMAGALGRLGDVTQDVLLAGPGSLGDAARAGGVDAASRITATYGRIALSPTMLRSWMRDQPHAYDVIHCWSVGALTAASMVARRTPKLLTITTTPGSHAMRLLRVLAGESRAPVALLPISATLRRDLLSAGLPEHAVVTLRPGIDQGRVDHAARQPLRRKWAQAIATNGEQPSEHVKIVAVLGDPVQAIDARTAGLIAAIAEDSLAADEPRIRLLVHPDQKGFHAAHRMMRNQSRAVQFIQTTGTATPWALLSACDVALSFGPAAGGLSMLWAMAANVPIVSEATYAVSEIIEDRHSALLAKPDTPHALAHRICQLCSDDQLAWKLKDTARHEAYSFFSRKRYCDATRIAYDQMVKGQPVELPDLEVTGGLRFAGRA